MTCYGTVDMDLTNKKTAIQEGAAYKKTGTVSQKRLQPYWIGNRAHGALPSAIFFLVFFPQQVLAIIYMSIYNFYNLLP